MTDTIAQAVQIDDSVTTEQKTVTLSTGVTVMPTTVSRLLIADAVKRVKRPKPPTIYIESKGRHEENETDPEYIEAVEQYEADMADILFNLLILRGMKVVHVPESVPSLESEEWIEDLKFLGIEVPQSPRARFVAWVKYIAAPEEEDLTFLANKLRGTVGVPDAEVSSAADGFQSDETPSTDNGTAPTTDSP